MTTSDPWLAAFLSGASGAQCPACGAALADGSGRCGRCRRRYTVGLAAQGRYRVGWAVALTSLSLMVGIGLLVATVLVFKRDFARSRPGLVQWELYAMAACGAGALVGVFTLVCRRKRFCTWPWGWRMLVVLGLTGVVLVEAVGLFYLDR